MLYKETSRHCLQPVQLNKPIFSIYLNIFLPSIQSLFETFFVPASQPCLVFLLGRLYHFYEAVFSRTKACNGTLMWESCLMKLCSGTSLAISPIIASYIIPSRATIGGSGGNERYLAAARAPIGELKWNKAAESPAGSWPAPAHLFGSHRWLSPRTTTRPTNQVWT